MAGAATTRPAEEGASTSSSRRRRRCHCRFGAAPVLVVLFVAAAMTPLQGLCVTRAAALGPPLLRRTPGWVVSPARLQQLSALLDAAGWGFNGAGADNGAKGRSRRLGLVAPLAAETDESGSASAGKKACLVGNVGVVSPYKGQPPAYRHLVYPGNDTAAEAIAFHRDWPAEARFRLRVRVAPSRVPPSASIAASEGAGASDSPPLLMAEGELVKLSMPMEGDAGEGEGAWPRTVWKTRAWVGDGEGRREATYELIAQGMAAAQSLGAQHMSLDVASPQLAQELARPEAAVEGPATLRLVSLHEKVLAARKKHFPGAAFTVVVNQDEEKGAAEEEEEKNDANDDDGGGAYTIQGGEIRGMASLGLVKTAKAATTEASRLKRLAHELAWASKVAAAERRGDMWVQTLKKNEAARQAPAERTAAERKGKGPTASSGKTAPPPSGSPLSSPSLPTVKPRSTYLLRFDGGSRGNPGPSGAGIVLYEEKKGQGLEEVMADALWLGASGTNNEAEYKGLIAGLQAAKRIGIKHLCVEGDSQLVVRQMLGQYKVKTERLKPLHAEAQALSREFDTFVIQHIERALNSRADELANQALDRAAEASFNKGK